MIKNIIFDVGNVLVEFRPYERMKDLNFPKEVIDILMEKVVMNPVWSEFDLGVKSDEEVLELFKSKAPLYEEYLEKLFEDFTDICFSYDYSASWVKSFQDRGFNTYVLSNYPVNVWKLHEKTQFTFMPYMNGKIVSAMVKMVKPNEDIYYELLKTYNLKAEECIFMDDRIDNVNTANRLGFHGIVFTSKDEVDQKINEIIEKY